MCQIISNYKNSVKISIKLIIFRQHVLIFFYYLSLKLSKTAKHGNNILADFTNILLQIDT